jgi:hypothetical protein
MQITSTWCKVGNAKNLRLLNSFNGREIPMKNLIPMSIAPKCVGCENVVMEGPVEALSETTCRIFVGPKHRFNDKTNCLQASHLTNNWTKRTNKINPLKASKKAAAQSA